MLLSGTGTVAVLRPRENGADMNDAPRPSEAIISVYQWHAPGPRPQGSLSISIGVAIKISRTRGVGGLGCKTVSAFLPRNYPDAVNY